MDLAVSVNRFVDQVDQILLDKKEIAGQIKVEGLEIDLEQVAENL